MNQKKLHILAVTLCILFCSLILILSERGKIGNPSSQALNAPEWQEQGPFELSPERGRFALTYSIVEDHSLFFSLPVARFATPDLGLANNRYVSLFAPAVSYIVIPGYILGKAFGVTQVGTYAIISIFALLNTLLIFAIARRLGAHFTASLIAGLIFLFATPAFVYAVSLFQHHISIFLILLALYILMRWNNYWSLAAIWFLCAAAIPVDYPNLFLMAPIGVAALFRIISVKKSERGFTFTIRFIWITSMLSAIVPLLFFMWFNANAYGNPFQLSGTIPSVKAIDENGQPAKPADIIAVQQQTAQAVQGDKNAVSFFKTRNLLNGLYEHIFSTDRGIIQFTPVILFGILGLFLLLRKKRQEARILIAIIGLDLLLYSMWGDPYGGWAFGSRYLTPAYALLAIGIAIMLSAWRRNVIVLIFFCAFAAQSIWINSLGAITSSSNPPQIEVLQLEKLSGHEEKYSFDRNWQDLTTKGSKSFFFQTYAARYISPVHYHQLIDTMITTVLIGLVLSLVFSEMRKKSTYE